MSKIKNKELIYAIMREDTDKGQDVVCCFSRTLVGAEDLCGEYEQAWIDSGGGDEAHYYVVSNVFYDK